MLVWATAHNIGKVDTGIGAYFARWLGLLLSARGRRAAAWAPGVADDDDAVALNFTYNVDDGWSHFGPRDPAGMATWQQRLADYTAKGIDVVLSAPVSSMAA